MHMQGKIGISSIGQLGIDCQSLPDILPIQSTYLPKRREKTALLIKTQHQGTSWIQGRKANTQAFRDQIFNHLMLSLKILLIKRWNQLNKIIFKTEQEIFIYFKIFIYLFTYFWLCWVFVAARGLSLVVSGGLLFIVVRGLLIAVASLVAEHGL